MPSFTLRANLAACIVFCLLALGIGVVVGDVRWTSLKESAGGFALLISPIVIWSSGAWMLKGHEELSIAWLVASIVLMMVGLLGIYVDSDAWRREKLTGQETMHFAGFLAMLLQWLMAVVLLAAAGAICLFSRNDLPTQPR